MVYWWSTLQRKSWVTSCSRDRALRLLSCASPHPPSPPSSTLCSCSTWLTLIPCKQSAQKGMWSPWKPHRSGRWWPSDDKGERKREIETNTKTELVKMMQHVSNFTRLKSIWMSSFVSNLHPYCYCIFKMFLDCCNMPLVKSSVKMLLVKIRMSSSIFCFYLTFSYFKKKFTICT